MFTTLKFAASTTLCTCADVAAFDTLPESTTDPLAWLRRMSSFGNNART